jgi:tetratricopeptide (TPR) repeat protein
MDEFSRGLNLFRDGKYSEAQPWFQKAFEINPTDNSIFSWLAVCLTLQNRFTEALPLHEFLTKTFPREAQYAYHFADCLKGLGRLKDALNEYQRAVDLEPKNSDYQNGLGLFLFEGKRYREAETRFREALALAPEDSTINSNLAHSLLQLNRWQEAEFFLQTAARLDPSDENNFYLAECIAKDGRTGLATTIYWQIIRRENRTEWTGVLATALNDLGTLKFNSKQYKDAFALYNAAIRLSQQIGIEPQAVFWNNLEQALKNSSSNGGLIETLKAAYSFEDENRRFLTPTSVLKAKPDIQSESKTDFDSWLLMGREWTKTSAWRNPKKSSVLITMFESGAQWLKPASRLFSEYNANEDSINESLACIESLSEHFNRHPETPIYLQSARVTIAMEIAQDSVRAWVGRSNLGLTVSMSLNNWELSYNQDHPDASFAVGAMIHFFIDCSMGIVSHPGFQQVTSSSDTAGSLSNGKLYLWNPTQGFEKNIDDIVSGRKHAPPRAHRVSGHVRTLSEGIPTDEARLKAPSYIRRNLGPYDTWVNSYTKGGDASQTDRLARLKTQSSLSDYLAICL